MGDRIARNGPSSYWECLGMWRVKKITGTLSQGGWTEWRSRKYGKSLTSPPRRKTVANSLTLRYVAVRKELG